MNRTAFDEASTVSLQAQLHELAEALQAAGSYFETLRNRARQAGSNLTVETAMLDKLAKQFARAEETLHRMRDQVNGGERNAAFDETTGGARGRARVQGSGCLGQVRDRRRRRLPPLS